MNRRLNSTPVNELEDKGLISEYFHEESIIQTSNFDNQHQQDTTFQDKCKTEKPKSDLRSKSPAISNKQSDTHKPAKNLFFPQDKPPDNKKDLEKTNETQFPALTLQLNLTFPRRKVKDSKRTELEKNLDALFSGETHLVHECLCIPREGTNILNCECKPVDKPISSPLLDQALNSTKYYQPPGQHLMQDSSSGFGGRYATQTIVRENLRNNEPSTNEKTYTAKENFQYKRYPCGIIGQNKFNYCANYGQPFQSKVNDTEEEFYVNPDPSFLHRKHNVNDSLASDSTNCDYNDQNDIPPLNTNTYTNKYDAAAYSPYEPNYNSSFPEKSITKKDKSTATEMKYLINQDLCSPNPGLLSTNPLASPQIACVPPQNPGLLSTNPLASSQTACVPPQNPGLLSTNPLASPQNACVPSQNPGLVCDNYAYDMNNMDECELQQYPPIEEECESQIAEQESFGFTSEQYDMCSDVNNQNYYYPPYGNF